MQNLNDGTEFGTLLTILIDYNEVFRTNVEENKDDTYINALYLLIGVKEKQYTTFCCFMWIFPFFAKLFNEMSSLSHFIYF